MEPKDQRSKDWPSPPSSEEHDGRILQVYGMTIERE